MYVFRLVAAIWLDVDDDDDDSILLFFDGLWLVLLLLSSVSTSDVASPLRFLFVLSLDFDEKNMSIRPPPKDFFGSAASTGTTTPAAAAAADAVGSVSGSFAVVVVDGAGDEEEEEEEEVFAASVRGFERASRRLVVVAMRPSCALLSVLSPSPSPSHHSPS